MKRKEIRALEAALAIISAVSLAMVVRQRMQHCKTAADTREAARTVAPQEDAELQRKKKIRIVLMSLLAVVFLASVGMMIRQQIQYRKMAADREDAARIAGLQEDAEPQRTVSVTERAEEPTPEPTSEPTSEPLPEEALDLAEIDLEALRAVNADVVGWIAIPGTSLSYPLLQGEDNQYYLTHTWKGEYNPGGSVFLESTNKPDLSAFHTIAYAHRMRNETMFGPIKHYNDLDFWQEHPSVYIVLDDTIYRYDIFSAHEVSVKGIVYRLDIEERHLEEEFIQYCLDNSVIDTGLVPEAGSRFLTLSTCTAISDAAMRWVVHGVLVQKYSRTNI